MREPGIYKNVPIEEYHAEEGLSSTGARLILESPKKFKHYFLDKKGAFEPTDETILGTRVHMLALEPEKFEKTYYEMYESVNLSTKAGKEAYEKAKQVAGDREVIRCRDKWGSKIRPMANAVGNCLDRLPAIGWNFESSIYWDSGVMDTRLRARPDCYETIVVDIKTTNSIKDFERSIFKRGYHIQAAMQIDGLNHFVPAERDYLFLVVESVEPYITRIFRLDENAIEAGRRKYKKAAEIYSACMNTGKWGRDDDVIDVVTPPYIISDLIEEIDEEGF